MHIITSLNDHEYIFRKDRKKQTKDRQADAMGGKEANTREEERT